MFWSDFIGDFQSWKPYHWTACTWIPCATLWCFYRYSERGWQRVAIMHGTHNVTLLEYTRYIITHQDWFDIMTRAHKLHQQYLVNIWVWIEEEILSMGTIFWSCGQEDALDTCMTSTQTQINWVFLFLVLLPSSFIGGPQFMQQKYHDMMAIAGKIHLGHYTHNKSKLEGNRS